MRIIHLEGLSKIRNHGIYFFVKSKIIRNMLLLAIKRYISDGINSVLKYFRIHVKIVQAHGYGSYNVISLELPKEEI